MKRQMTKFEMLAHDIQYKKKHHADHGQLGDTPLFDKIDWFEVAVIGAVVVIFGCLAILIK